MSILIKGMDMLKDGTYTARIHVKDGVAILDNPTGAGYFELLPIQTPHGKLIDVNELDPDAEWSDWHDGYTAYSQFEIDCTPAVIESED